MPIVRINDEGVEETLYTQEEIAQEQSRLAELEAENEHLKQVNAEKTENFRRLNQMTEEERSRLSATEIEIKKQLEIMQDEKKSLEERLAAKELAQIEATKNSVFKAIAGDDADTNTKLKNAYDLINMPEGTPEEIQARALAAANMARITIVDNETYNSSSPLNAFWSGDSPSRNPHAKKDGDDYNTFIESDKAKAAFRAMGDEIE